MDIPAPTKTGPARRSRPVRVAEAIKGWVVEQGLEPGDRLPGEAELIDRFGMSKGTIREAMRLLQAQGLVVTKTGPGGGSFVGQVTTDRAHALLANYFYFQNISIDDIYVAHPVVHAWQSADSTWNLAQLLAPSDTTATDTTSSGFTVTIDEGRIARGEIGVRGTRKAEHGDAAPQQLFGNRSTEAARMSGDDGFHGDFL